MVERLLGEGGMASVHCVIELSSGRTLALKRLSPSAHRNAKVLFEREYQTLATLRHPNIVEVYEYGTDEDGPYYTMELLEGRDLQHFAPAPWRDVCRWLRDVASTLGPLHSRHLLHRDLSSRNLWRTPSGLIKLIDFGAVAPFGTAGEIVGTPPFVPPEALGRKPLDQRADLYSLGALGYWLLTGVHAFPARSLAELPELWGLSLAPASQRVLELGRTDLPPLPPELDALLLALLSRDPDARPLSSAELIDRLDVITGFQETSDAPRGHFSAKFVGRAIERQLVGDHLRAASGATLCFEGPSGIGKTRLLQDLAVQGRLLGAKVVHIDTELNSGPYALAEALALKLLTTVPDAAFELVKPFAPTLGHLSAALRDSLGLSPAELTRLPGIAGDARVRIQSALRDWLVEVGRRERLLIAIDDVQSADDSSAAALLAIARAAETSRIVMIMTFRTEQEDAASPAASALRQAVTQRSTLAALSGAQTLELLGSAFGDVPNLPRLASRLQRLSQGNVRHCLELAGHLVRNKVVVYSDGTWVLPADVSDEDLPKSRGDALRAEIEALPEPVKQLARLLSVRAEPTSFTLCATISGLSGVHLREQLETLVRAGVLVGSSESFRFASEEVRESLLVQLAPERVRAAHLQLAELMLGRPEVTTVARLKAGVHLLKAGEMERGVEAVVRAALRLVSAEIDRLGDALSALEEALALLALARRSVPERLPVLTALCGAGLYSHRRFATKYGREALAAFDSVLHLSLAARLRPFLGRHVALFVALSWAALAFALRRRERPSPGLRETLSLLGICVSVLTGVHTICIDPESAGAAARMLEPLTALGKNHVASFAYEFCSTLAMTVRDTQAAAYERWSMLLEKLKRREDIRGLEPDHHLQYVGGALYARGVLETYRDGLDALRTAESLDALKTPFATMSGDKVRMMHYALQGNLDLARQYRERVEQHAIEQGTAWQVETWSPSASIMIYLRTYDAMGMKHDMEQLTRLSREVPSLQIYHERAQGTYRLLRGQPAAALQSLEACRREKPRAVTGWARAHGVLARAYNALGRHAEARAVCREVLSILTPADLMFTTMMLMLETELALAEANLGNVESAADQLDALIRKHGELESPLTMGLLHETRAQVAILAGDPSARDHHLVEMERWYRSTSAPSLVAHCERLRRQFGLIPRGEPRTGQAASSTTIDESRSVTPQDAWSELLRSCNAQEGFVLLSADASPRVPRLETRPVAPDVHRWAEARMEAALHEDSATEVLDSTAPTTDVDVMSTGGVHHRLNLLRGIVDTGTVLGVAVVSRHSLPPDKPSLSSLSVVARALRLQPGLTSRPDSNDDTPEALLYERDS